MEYFWIIAQSDPAPNDPAVVTQSWMAGVVGMMLLFGVAALIGYIKKKSTR